MPKLGASLADISLVMKPIDEGPYAAEIGEVSNSPSKNHIPMIAITYSITEPGEFVGRKITDYFTLQTSKGEPNEAGLRGLKRVITAALSEDRANDEDFDTDELTGAAVTLYIKQEMYKDDAGDEQPSNKVKKVLPA